MIFRLQKSRYPNKRERYGFTPLHWAAATKRNPEAIKSLLRLGADINVRTEEGATPLHWAARNGSPDVINVLLQGGADIHAHSHDGSTPLHWAAGNACNPAVIKLLLRERARRAAIWRWCWWLWYSPEKSIADINARSYDGSTPLHWAAFHNSNPAVIEALLQAGADPGAWDQDGKTPWDYARKNQGLKGTESCRRLKELRK